MRQIQFTYSSHRNRLCEYGKRKTGFSYAIFLYQLCKRGFAALGLGTPVIVMHLIHLVCDLMCDFFLFLRLFFLLLYLFFPSFWMLIFLFSLFPAFRFAFLSHIFSAFSPVVVPPLSLHFCNPPPSVLCLLSSFSLSTLLLSFTPLFPICFFFSFCGFWLSMYFIASLFCPPLPCTFPSSSFSFFCVPYSLLPLLLYCFLLPLSFSYFMLLSSLMFFFSHFFLPSFAFLSLPFILPSLPRFPPLCSLSFSVFHLLFLSPPPLSIPFFLFIYFLAFNPFSTLTPFTSFSPLTYAKCPYRFS